MTTAKAGDVEQRRPVDQQLQRRRHRAEVGADVDRVGDDQQTDQRIEQRRRIVAAHVAGEPAAGHAADLRADLLDRAHQRIGEQQRPAEAVAELRAGLGIGGDAAGIVVGGAGDQAGAEHVDELGPFRLLNVFSQIDLKLAHTASFSVTSLQI